LNKKGHLDDVQMFLSYGADMNLVDNTRTSLHYAAEFKDIGVMKALVRQNAEINERDAYGRTPRHLAASKGHLESVEMCLKYGADRRLEDNEKKTPFNHAKDHGPFDVMKRLPAKKKTFITNVFGQFIWIFR